jgi:flagellar hook-associated protein 3 FlgL
MAFRSIGDLSSAMQMRFLNAELRSRIGQLGTELATGKVADVSKNLAGGLDQLGVVNRSLKILDSFKIAGSELTARGNALQLALAEVQAAVQANGAKTIAAANTLTRSSIDVAAQSALEGLEKTIGSLNSQTGGRSLFAGQAFRTSALIAAPDMLDELQSLAISATTSADIDTIIDDYFIASGGGFETSAYLGSSNLPTKVRISETESAGFPVSAENQNVRAVLASLAKAALIGRGVLGGNLDAQANLLTSAGEDMISATAEIVTLRAEIGGTQERIGLLEISNAARKTSLEITLGGMTLADGYETATKLQAAESSLEALYIATTKISQLSLTRYLR